MPGPKLMTEKEAMEYVVKTTREAKGMNTNVKALMTLAVMAEKNARALLQYRSAHDKLNKIYTLATEHIQEHGQITRIDWIQLHDKAQTEEQEHERISNINPDDSIISGSDSSSGDKPVRKKKVAKRRPSKPSSGSSAPPKKKRNTRKSPRPETRRG